MLTAIREGSKGWIAGIVIGLIVLTFALWGIGSYFEGGTQLPVATVNGDEIDPYTYQNQLSRQRQALTRQYGSSITSEMMEMMGLRQRVLDSLIESRLLNQFTTENNYRLTDSQVARRIRENELFQSDGGFDPALYERLLASNGLSPQGFEAGERQAGMNLQLVDAITETSFVATPELTRLIALENQSRTTQYAIIPGDLYVDDFEISAEEVEREYEGNIERYHNPARMKVEYIDLSVDAIAGDINPSEEEIEQAYERIRDQLKTPAVRKASHILFSVDGEGEEEKSEALTKANAVLEEVNSGGDFTELAREYSDDPGSATNGGDLGVINRGQMVQPFEDAVFDMVENEVRGPVETRFGYHIIKLTELTEEQQQPLEEVRDEVVEEARRSAAEGIFSDLVEPFDNAIFEQPESLEAAADVAGLEIMTTDWFTRDEGEGIAGEQAVRAAAFSPDVLDEGLNSPAVELGFDRLVALRRLDHAESAPMDLEEVREEIVNALKLERSQARAIETAVASIGDLTHLASWDIRLAINEWRQETLPGVRREIPSHLSSLAERVFGSSVPENGRPVYGHAVLANGDVAIFALTDVVPGDVESIEENQRLALESELTRRDGEEAFNRFVEILRERADISINEEQVEQL